MAKKSQGKGINYEIKEVLGVASPVEDLRTPIVKGVLRSLWDNNGVLEEGVDIRRFNQLTKVSFGGIRLTLEEAHRVCDILLERGYGSTDVIEKAYKARMNLYKEETE